jgi:hypothetical protein
MPSQAQTTRIELGKLMSYTTHLVYVTLAAAVGVKPHSLQLAAQLLRHLSCTQHAVLVDAVAC